jgi:hypothetical protein
MVLLVPKRLRAALKERLFCFGEKWTRNFYHLLKYLEASLAAFNHVQFLFDVHSGILTYEFPTQFFLALMIVFSFGIRLDSSATNRVSLK